MTVHFPLTSKRCCLFLVKFGSAMKITKNYALCLSLEFGLLAWKKDITIRVFKSIFKVSINEISMIKGLMNLKHVSDQLLASHNLRPKFPHLKDRDVDQMVSKLAITDTFYNYLLLARFSNIYLKYNVFEGKVCLISWS